MSADALNPEPTKRSLLRRIAAWWMRPWIVIAGVILLMIVGGPFAYRGYWISRVPWIEDPFDIQAMQELKVRDEDNALDDYRQAVSLFVELNFKDLGEWRMHWGPHTEGIRLPLINSLWSFVLEDGWNGTPPPIEKWLDANRATLEHWKRAASKPDYQYIVRGTNNPKETDPFSMDRMDFDFCNPSGLAVVTCLEAMRLHARGDAEAAWDLLLVNLRDSHHVSRHGGLADAYNAGRILTTTQQAIERWAQQPHVDASLLRKALSDLAAEESRRSTIVPTALRVDYWQMMPLFNNTVWHAPGTTPVLNATWIEKSYHFLHGEPQVSHRTMRHLMASMLPEAAKERAARLPAVGTYKLYEPSASHPVAHATTSDMERFIEQSALNVNLAEYLDWSDRVDAQHQLLFITLALELFKREHGEYPERLEQLSTVVPSIKLVDIFAMPPAPLHYDRGQSFAKVWSVGVNGVDDGGNVDRSMWRDISVLLGKPPEPTTE